MAGFEQSDDGKNALNEKRQAGRLVFFLLAL
jgi:hypothetical protein